MSMNVVTEREFLRRQVFEYLAFAIGLAALAYGLLACGTTPTPVPDPPGPAPVDVFDGQLFDCRSDVVAVERDSVTPLADGCLRTPEPATCFGALGKQYFPASVACSARDLGAKANADHLADPTNRDAKLLADACRTWICAKGMGFR
jgi:hypothetical protein